MPGRWFVYALRDPRDGAVRYVGVTKKSLAERLSGHVNKIGSDMPPRLSAWISDLQSIGARPTIEQLETITSVLWTPGESLRVEGLWIQRMLEAGADLLNTSNRAWLALPVDHPGRRLHGIVRSRGLTYPQAG